MPHKDIEKTRAYEKEYRRKHAAKIKEYQSIYRTLNAEQAKEYKKAYYVNNKGSRYGLTPETLSDLVDKQDHACAICKTSFEDTRMNIDHCHSTGVVRGLLCFHCNTGLGHFKDNKQRLQQALEYLSD
jgi:5-methylcytosine-specific restriction endonuclease McrA